MQPATESHVSVVQTSRSSQETPASPHEAGAGGPLSPPSGTAESDRSVDAPSTWDEAAPSEAGVDCPASTLSSTGAKWNLSKSSVTLQLIEKPSQTIAIRLTDASRSAASSTVPQTTKPRRV